jgi:cytochrome c oxidase subunit 2
MSFARQTLARRLAIALVALFVALGTGCAGEYPQSTFRPVTEFGARIDELFMGVFWWTMLVLGIVLVVLTYVLIRFRARPGVEAKKVYGNNLAEILWTAGPAVIVVAILVPTVRTIFYTYREAPENALVVEAIGHQWWWEFRYPELGITTANQLYLPVGRPVDVHLSSADVIHNFWIPRIAGKRYNYPIPVLPEGAPQPKNHNRLVFTVDEAGEYSGQCAEFCGTSHALMRMRVIAQPEAEFAAWAEGMKAPVAAIPAEGTKEEKGYQVFMKAGCVACHSVAGTPARGVIGPNLTDVGSRWSIGAGTVENTPEKLAAWIKKSSDLKPDSKMIPFPQLAGEDLEALVAYLHSLK